MELYREEVTQEFNYRKRARTYPILIGSASATLLGLLLLVTLLDVPRTLPAKGMVAPTGGVARLLSASAGTVIASDVREGQHVNAGDTLVQISSDKFRKAGDEGVSADSVRQIEASIASELRHADSIREIIQSTIDQLKVRKSKLEDERQSLQREGRLQSDRVKAYEQVSAKYQELKSKEFVSELNLRLREADELSERSRLEVLHRTEKTTENEIKVAELQMNEARARIAAELELSKQKIALLRKDLNIATVETGGVIRAPVSGKISSVQFVVGQTVSQQQELLTIIPEGRKLEARVRVSATAAGKVAVGQPAQLRFPAFPFVRHGSRPSTVEWVTQLPSNGANGESSFVVGIPLGNDDEVHTQIEPGMSVEAEIVVGKAPLWVSLLPRVETHSSSAAK